MEVRKRAFYATESVERVLQSIPRGQQSSRVNELILKGLALEKMQKIREAYEEYDLAPPEEGEQLDSWLSQGAFQPEDEVEDFI